MSSPISSSCQGAPRPRARRQQQAGCPPRPSLSLLVLFFLSSHLPVSSFSCRSSTMVLRFQEVHCSRPSSSARSGRNGSGRPERRIRVAPRPQLASPLYMTRVGAFLGRTSEEPLPRPLSWPSQSSPARWSTCTSKLQETAMTVQQLKPRHGLARSARSPAAHEELSLRPGLPPQALFLALPTSVAVLHLARAQAPCCLPAVSSPVMREIQIFPRYVLASVGCLELVLV
ncbi:uncharacterized protein LOC123446177 [Hordeum vulgare subsp. vulgare]|uniref:Predicted protein n=1 Tax=Hordeum vulgare subsp. vulgare TaxID=112509 RepID=F2D3X5_HORVV|nr:uncharacterized protein LOC123446177 [Hordeum vulgare subsp. vulgare]BAJ89796.1 predicted protein [Hordeum vulgare subsp. vulgare]